MNLGELEPDVVILACAVSAGIHGALVPRHFDEGTGAGFVAAAVVLAGLVIWLSRRPDSRPALLGAAALFAGLLGSYALAVTTGLPLLHPDPEPVDGLALATKAVESGGLLAAASLLWRPVAVPVPQPKGNLT